MATAISEALSEIAINDPNRLVLDGPGGTLTYAQLQSEVDRLAGWIADRVIGHEDAIAVRTTDARTAMTAFLAIERCGRVTVPIDPSAPLHRALFMAGEVEADLILTDDAAFFESDERVRLVATAIAEGRAFGLPVERPDDAICSIIFTSGSTGVPKGIVTNWRRQQIGIERLHSSGMSSGAGRICLPFMGTISNSIAMVSACVALGRTLVPYDVKRQGVQGMAQFLRDQRIRSFATVPTLLRLLLDTADPQMSLPELKVIVTWGEGLTWNDVGRLRRHLPPDAVIHATYGTTEASGVATYRITPDEPLGKGLVPAGKVTEGITVRIVDRDGNEVEQGAEGEIVVIGDDVGLEYWRRPDLSERVFRVLPDGARACWTRDRGRKLADGNLQHLGRLDHMVKISGNRVDLGEIEVALRAMPEIGEAGVIVRADAAGDTRILAFVTERADPVVPGEIRSRLVRQLPGYMVPDSVHVLDAMPMLANGKVDRRSLQTVQIIPGHRSGEASSSSPLEQGLLAIWSEVLDCAVGVGDTLADLGVDSIRAARAFALIEQRLGHDRPISLLLEAPTVGDLAERLRATDERWHPLVPVRTAGSRAPLFVVHGGGGDVMFAVTLAEHLDPDIPVYGLQPATLSGRIVEDVSVEALARNYVRAIRAVQPTGPYFLFGYSLGGLIAFEMACVLEEVGAQVALVGIGDTSAPGAARARECDPEPTPPLTVRNVAGRALRSAGFRARRRRHEASRRRTFRRMRRYVRRGQIVPPELRKEFSMWQLGEHSHGYRPSTACASQLLLIRTGSSGGVTPDSWRPFATGDIVVIEIPGRHMQLIHEPMIAQLGEALGEHCTAALAQA